MAKYKGYRCWSSLEILRSAIQNIQKCPADVSGGSRALFDRVRGERDAVLFVSSRPSWRGLIILQYSAHSAVPVMVPHGTNCASHRALSPSRARQNPSAGAVHDSVRNRAVTTLPRTLFAPFSFFALDGHALANRKLRALNLLNAFQAIQPPRWHFCLLEAKHVNAISRGLAATLKHSKLIPIPARISRRP